MFTKKRVIILLIVAIIGFILGMLLVRAVLNFMVGGSMFGGNLI